MRKKSILSALVALLLTMLAFFIYLKVYKGPATEIGQSTNNAEDDSGNQNKSAQPSNKPDEVKSTSNGTNAENNDGSDGKSVIDVVISDASQYGKDVEVRSFVPGITQNGTCIFTFSKVGYQSLTRIKPAYADAASSICINLTVSANEFPATGIWELSVEFSSKSYAGKSTVQSVEVQK